MQTVSIPNSSLHRDIKSMGLIETDPRKIDEYRAKKLMINTAKEVDSLKQDMNEIKTLLKEVLNGIR